jgi:hypothetical protein
MMGGAVFVSAGQSVFDNILLRKIRKLSQTINPSVVLEIGAGSLRDAFSGSELTTVLESYMSGLKAAFAFGTGVAGVAVLVSLWAPYKTIKGKEVTTGAA